MNNRMKLNVLSSSVAMFAMVCVLVAMAGTASAGEIAECKARIDIVRGDVPTVVLDTQNADKVRAGLLSKLAAADSKLDLGKRTDAKLKLEDFKTTVEYMRDATKAKISSGDAALLLKGAPSPRTLIDEGVEGAIICVAGQE